MDRSDWIEQAVLSLALDGNLFLLKKAGPDGTTLSAEILPPAEVLITRDPKTRAIRYHYRGTPYTRAEVQHQTLMRLPGHDRGLGPIQAARREIGGATDVRDYASQWFHGSGQPSGLLTSKAARTAEEAKAARDRWNEAAADPDNPTGVRVIGGDTEYVHLALNPADAQWLEVRAFTVTDLARLFGIPSALMLVSLEGNSLTYSNVEQEWLAFTRFTLMQYLRKIEEALTELSPYGQRIKFNVEALLRTDTESRYAGYAVAIDHGFLTPTEVRALEGRDPLTADQRAEVAQYLAASRPTQEVTAGPRPCPSSSPGRTVWPSGTSPACSSAPRPGRTAPEP
jgi:HK97 family phage portal protein